MACFLLALYGVVCFGSGIFSTISTLAMMIDAYIGFYLFVTERHGDVWEYLSYFNKTIYRPTEPVNSDGNKDDAFAKI